LQKEVAFTAGMSKGLVAGGKEKNEYQLQIYKKFLAG
jgi:hypothetical protein